MMTGVFHLCPVVYVGYIQNVGINGKPMNLICFYTLSVTEEVKTVNEKECVCVCVVDQKDIP